jgi:hypothetical protein
MSIYAISRLAWDIEHVDDVLDALKHNPDDVLSRYDLTPDEAEAIRNSDARWLLAHGVNPVVLRNLIVVQGTPHSRMYEAPPARGQR